jgi:hypothetical protein
MPGTCGGILKEGAVKVSRGVLLGAGEREQ